MEYYNSVCAYYAGRDNKVLLACLDIVNRQVSSFGDLRPKVDREDLFSVGVMRLMVFMKEQGEGFLAENIRLIRDCVRTSLVDYLRKELGRKNVYDHAQAGPSNRRVYNGPRYIHQRRRISLEDCKEPADTRPGSDTLYSILERERRDVIQKALEHLGPLEGEIMRLYYLEGKKEHEIAERFGVAQGAISWHIERAREKMEHHLRRYYFCEFRR